ncbi:MAG TPA: hypothetical protein VL974_14865 [Magnetospirillum sp.]|jgi:hypothetical protein|nr:hypothetical protein [Magnetospirillum sp.]
MQDAAVAIIVAAAALAFGVKVVRAVLRRCRGTKSGGCDKCCKCG